MMLSEDSIIKLRLLSSANPSDQKLKKVLVQSASDAFISLLLSVTLSVVLGKLRLTDEQHRVLRKSAHVLTQLASQNQDLLQKRKLLGNTKSLNALRLVLSFVLPQIIEEQWTPTSLESSPELDRQSPAALL